MSLNLKVEQEGYKGKGEGKENLQAEGILPLKFVSTDLVLIISLFISL